MTVGTTGESRLAPWAGGFISGADAHDEHEKEIEHAEPDWLSCYLQYMT